MTITTATKLADLNYNEDALSLNHLADETILDADAIGLVWDGMSSNATVGDYIADLTDYAAERATTTEAQ